MKGHIYQRAKGSWTIVYDLPMDVVTGKRRQKWQTVRGTKRDAERALREVLLSVEQGSYVKPNKLSLGELLRIQLGISLNADDFVFIPSDGSPINPNAVTLAFRRIIKRAGLKGVRIHDLRHTHATLMLKAGIHPKVVSERLGHANIGITLDIYSHVLPGIQEAAAEKFDKIFEVGETENSDANVSKMLANSGDLATEPCGTRTHDTLIKSQVLYQLS